jgi:hypothetical protein
MMGLLRRGLDYLFFMSQWNIGTVRGSLDTVVHTGELPPIHWWRRPSSAIFSADPCFLGDEIVFERMNRWRGRAELWLARADGTCARRFIRRPDHLSYPCVTDMCGRTFLVYEASSSGACSILERRGGRWHTVALIEQPIVDGTLLHRDGLWWLFGTLADGTENDALHIWWSEAIGGPWQAHELNPVKRDPSCSRPAGRFHLSNLGLIRPAQDCSSTYGGGIALCRVDRLDRRGFEEVVLRRLRPEKEYPLGIHTINGHSDTLVIDGKRRVFHPMAALLKWTSRTRSTRPSSPKALPSEMAIAVGRIERRGGDTPHRLRRGARPAHTGSARQ